jgi:hypothetical protein
MMVLSFFVIAGFGPSRWRGDLAKLKSDVFGPQDQDATMTQSLLGCGNTQDSNPPKDRFGKC